MLASKQLLCMLRQLFSNEVCRIINNEWRKNWSRLQTWFRWIWITEGGSGSESPVFPNGRDLCTSTQPPNVQSQGFCSSSHNFTKQNTNKWGIRGSTLNLNQQENLLFWEKVQKKFTISHQFCQREIQFAAAAAADIDTVANFRALETGNAPAFCAWPL